MRVRELAERLSLEFEGNGELEITAAADLEGATPSELAFAGARKYWKAADESGAGCLIVTSDFTASNRALLRAGDPRAAFASALKLLYPAPAQVSGIHPTAVVADGAQLGANVHVGPHACIENGVCIGDGSTIGAGCVISAGVRIGSGARLHPRVTVYAGVTIGDRAIIHSGAVLGADGFGFVPFEGAWQKFPQVGGVKIGDDVEIGANTCIDRAALGVTVIGNGVKLDNMVHIAHNCKIGDHVVIAAQTGLSGGVIVGNNAIIGGQVGIGDKARIESGAVLGSGCGVLTSKIVRAGQPVWGTPARPLRQYLEQLAQVARLPQTKEELHRTHRQLTHLAEQLGLQLSAPTSTDPTTE